MHPGSIIIMIFHIPIQLDTRKNEFTSDCPPQISVSLHQLDFAPYVSGSYNAQWNTPKLLHDKHMLHSSCILGKMGVEESLLGLWLPLHY